MPALQINGPRWHPDLPDFRDYDPLHPEVVTALEKLSAEPLDREVSSQVDLRNYFEAIQIAESNERISSSAQACVAVIEYCDYRATGVFDNLSAEFLGLVSAQSFADGCSQCDSLRSTIKTMVRVGLPPTKAVLAAASDVDPPLNNPFLYTFGEKYHSFTYFRLDQDSTEATLASLKSFLAAGFPVMFGFGVPSSLKQNEQNIEYRPTFDSIQKGQAVLAVGFDDQRVTASVGSLLIRAFWGKEWGEDGFGWLPYSFVLNRMACDFWVLLSETWLTSGEFRRPKLVGVDPELDPSRIT